MALNLRLFGIAAPKSVAAIIFNPQAHLLALLSLAVKAPSRTCNLSNGGLSPFVISLSAVVIEAEFNCSDLWMPLTLGH